MKQIGDVACKVAVGLLEGMAPGDAVVWCHELSQEYARRSGNDAAFVEEKAWSMILQDPDIADLLQVAS